MKINFTLSNNSIFNKNLFGYYGTYLISINEVDNSTFLKKTIKTGTFASFIMTISGIRGAVTCWTSIAGNDRERIKLNIIGCNLIATYSPCPPNNNKKHYQMNLTKI